MTGKVDRQNGVVGGPGAVATSAVLVGRDRKLAELTDALEGAISGRGGRTVFVVGEAGIGKTRLARAVADEAERRGVPVLRGRASQTATAAAYRPVAEALSSALRAGVGPDVSDIGRFRPTIGRLVPEWRDEDQPLAEESQVAVAEAVLRFLRATAGSRGALVVLEDLHAADPETLTTVEYVADNLEAERVLLVCTLRPTTGAPAADLVRSLRARGAAAVTELTPLEPDEVAAMVASCLGVVSVPSELVELASRSEGIPFMVEELLATALSTGALVDDGGWRVEGPLDAMVPGSLAESVRRRVDDLGRDGRAVIAAAAVLGRRFDWRLLPAITELAEADVTEALRQSIDAQLVVFERAEGTFAFRHALSRDAVLAALLPPEMRAWSRRALAAVEASHPAGEDEWGELAAELAIQAEDHGRAAVLLLEIAGRALRQGALATAEATLDRARALGSDRAALELDELLLEVLALAGKQARAGEVAADLLAQLGDDDPASARRRAEVHLRLARAAVAATRWTEAHEHLERAADAAAGISEGDVAVRVEVLRAHTAVVRDPGAALPLAEAALSDAERLGLHDVACEALELIGRVRRPHDLAAAEAAFSRALTLAETHRLGLWRARALHELGSIDMLEGRPVDRLAEARELALSSGALATVAVVDVQMAAGLVLCDDPEPGRAAARRSVELGRRYRFDQTVAAALGLEAYAHARLRRVDDMRRCIEEAKAVAAGVPDLEVKIFTAQALLALVEEDRTAARSHLCAGLRAAARGGDYSVMPAIGFLALLRQVDGPDDEAPEISIPPSSVHFLAAAYLQYAAAVEAAQAGRGADATALVASADDRLREHSWFRHLAHRLVGEAVLGSSGGDGIRLLREALEHFDGTGDDRIASACRALLRRSGAPVPRRRDQSGVPEELRALGVTARELEVLQLLAGGLPNRDIGERLFLSPRTVERHIANLTVKAGVARRAELVAFAARTVTSLT
jgi:DNA-binding CsgD family transcriptional regulator/tetratricopeptide (TPR) repeat protein